MNALKVVAILIIIAGILGLVYGGFTYIRESKKANLGPIEVSVNEKQEVSIPVWVGLGAIIIGSSLLFIGFKNS